MSNPDPILIGIDGGGTSCRAALKCAAGMRLRQGGPANVSDFAGALANIVDVLGALASDTGLGPADLAGAHVHLGLAGVTNAAKAAAVATALGQAVRLARITVGDDQETTFAGALGAVDGAVAAIGTGSFVGRQVQGTLRVLGGWGFKLGDQASGAWLGQRLLQQVMLVFDGIEAPSPLTRDVLARHSGDPASIVAFAIAARPADFAALAPEVAEAAAADDRVAGALMAEGAAYIDRALAALGWRPDEPVCLAGGIGAAYRPYLPAAVVAALRPPLGNALDGALALAARDVGGHSGGGQ